MPWSNVRNYLPKSEMPRRTLALAALALLMVAKPAAGQGQDLINGYRHNKASSEHSPARPSSSLTS